MSRHPLFRVGRARWPGARLVLLITLTAALVAGTHLEGAAERRPGNPGALGLHIHETWLGHSRDGRSLDARQHKVADRASVPDVCAGPDGRGLVYYVDASQGFAGTSLTVRRLGPQGEIGPALPVVLEGESTCVPVDPEAISLPGGEVRLYYLAARRGRSQPRAGKVHEFHSALSRDGVHFVRERGVRIQGRGIVDPAVIRLAGRGAWKMYYAVLDDGSGRPAILSATSRDGLTFEPDPGVRLVGVGSPGAVALPGGGVRLYAGVSRGFSTWTSPDGLAFEAEGTTVTGWEALDPALAELPGGGYLVALKRFASPSSSLRILQQRS